MEMPKLGPDDWIDAGLAMLHASGFASLKADTLAKAIGVTRGSFYWHFSDLNAFHDAVLHRWRIVALERIVADLENVSGDRLETLLRRAFTDPGGLEVAVRACAIANPVAHAAVDAVDIERIGYLRALIVAEGIAADVADGRARVLNWSYLGFALSTAKPSARQTLRIIDDLLAFARSR
jgi:AcrR family transcriptional regulator